MRSLLRDLTGPRSQLMTQLKSTWKNAVAPTTETNQKKQAVEYITFIFVNNLDQQLLAPSPITLSLYFQSLANRFKSPISAENSLSGAKTYILWRGGDVSSFDNFLVKMAIRGNRRLSTHKPKQAPPLDVGTVARVAGVLAGMGVSALPARTVLLLGFTTFLRPSNLVSTTTTDNAIYDHTIRRGDVQLTATGLKVYVRSTKTTSAKQAFSLPVLPAAGPACPVQTWKDYVTAYPAPPSSKALVDATGRPLTPDDVVPDIRAALAAIKHPAALEFSLHSLRRSGARTAAASGATEQQVMRHGHWRSTAVRTYVPPYMYKRKY